MKSFKPFILAIYKLGLLNALYLKIQQYRINILHFNKPIYLYSKYSKYPLLCRPGTSDMQVIYQIFILREYSCLDNISDAQIIIDCGANVGYSSAYFLSKYPHAKIIAIEPNKNNFRVLIHNLRHDAERVDCQLAAVWSHPTELVFDNIEYGSEWAVRVRECKHNENPMVTATNLTTLIKECEEKRISILKIDIEGSEAVIFDTEYKNWIDKVDNIVIELHGDKCIEKFNSALQSYPFLISQYEELTIAKRHYNIL